MAGLNPYLTFNGNCAEAFAFYKDVFGGDFATYSKFKDVPAEFPAPVDDGEKLMHVALPIGQSVLMGSDRGEMHGVGVSGNNFSISCSADSTEDADKKFNGLAAGGTVTMPIQKTFWNSYFGMVTDKFGVQWMVSYDFNG